MSSIAFYNSGNVAQVVIDGKVLSIDKANFSVAAVDATYIDISNGANTSFLRFAYTSCTYPVGAAPGALVTLITNLMAVNFPLNGGTANQAFTKTSATDYDYSWQMVAIGTYSSGTYTPTLFNVANLDSSAAFACQYSRMGSLVTVSGRVDVNPTLTATLTQLGISLPIASALTANNQAGGVAFDSSIAGMGSAIIADAANDRVELDWVSTDITGTSFFFTFSYLVL